MARIIMQGMVLEFDQCLEETLFRLGASPRKRKLSDAVRESGDYTVHPHLWITRNRYTRYVIFPKFLYCIYTRLCKLSLKRLPSLFIASCLGYVFG